MIIRLSFGFWARHWLEETTEVDLMNSLYNYRTLFNETKAKFVIMTMNI
jgi:hypothetical protein